MTAVSAKLINQILPQTQCKECGYEGCLPYAEALAIGDFQNKIMEEIMQFPDISQKWDSPEVEEKIIQLLNVK